MRIDTKYPEVYIDLNITDLSFKIIQMIDGKHKVRRRVCGRAIKKSTQRTSITRYVWKSIVQTI